MRLFTFLILIGGLASAAPASAVKRGQRRAEASQAVSSIVSGEQVEASIARLRYLGEERFAFTRLYAAITTAADERLRRDLALALGALAENGAEPALSELLSDPDGAVRMHALKGLQRCRPKHPGVILPLIEDPTLGVRREAAKVLGRMHRRELGAKLLAAARQETEPEVRAELLLAVGDSGDPRQAAGLEAFLEGSSESARFSAARALCRLGAPRGIAEARRLLSSAERYERRQGVAMFEGTPARISGPHLRPLLAGEDKALAAYVARVLHQSGEPKMVDWLVLASYGADASLRSTIEREIEQIGVDTPVRKAILKRAGIK